MDPAPAAAGIWKHWKIIIAVLAFFLIVAISADVVLWYSMQKSDTAAQTLNDIIANQPPPPKTDADKTKLLDSLAAAHRAAAAQVEASSPKKGAVSAGNAQSAQDSQATIDAKIKLLDSLRKSQ